MRQRIQFKKCLIILLSTIFVTVSSACSLKSEIATDVSSRRLPYGVFLSLDNSNLNQFKNYNTIVIDAQYFTKEDIENLHAEGCTVYSYLNIGAIENFREYYEKYQELSLGAYENWEEEQWMDVASEKWQSFLIDYLAKGLCNLDIDGFFVDNCDIYYQFPSDSTFAGLTQILRGLMAYDKEVIVNGGDYFVDAYYDKHGTVKDILTGINQESVFSAIDFENKSFTKQTQEVREYFQHYITKYEKEEVAIYLLEYTKDEELKDTIKKYCDQKAFQYYISDSIELD